MSTYTVDLEAITLHQLSIEADNEEEAIEKAKDELLEEFDINHFTKWQASKAKP